MCLTILFVILLVVFYSDVEIQTCVGPLHFIVIVSFPLLRMKPSNSKKNTPIVHHPNLNTQPTQQLPKSHDLELPVMCWARTRARTLPSSLGTRSSSSLVPGAGSHWPHLLGASPWCQGDAKSQRRAGRAEILLEPEVIFHKPPMKTKQHHNISCLKSRNTENKRTTYWKTTGNHMKNMWKTWKTHLMSSNNMKNTLWKPHMKPKETPHIQGTPAARCPITSTANVHHQNLFPGLHVAFGP